MTFKAHLNKVNLVLVLALLAALLVPVIGFAAGQTVAFNALFDSGSTENAHSNGGPTTAIACGCGDPGGASGGCC
jgi:hypothetical protein